MIPLMIILRPLIFRKLTIHSMNERDREREKKSTMKPVAVKENKIYLNVQECLIYRAKVRRCIGRAIVTKDQRNQEDR